MPVPEPQYPGYEPRVPSDWPSWLEVPPTLQEPKPGAINWLLRILNTPPGEHLPDPTWQHGGPTLTYLMQHPDFLLPLLAGGIGSIPALYRGLGQSPVDLRGAGTLANNLMTGTAAAQAMLKYLIHALANRGQQQRPPHNIKILR